MTKKPAKPAFKTKKPATKAKKPDTGKARVTGITTDKKAGTRKTATKRTIRKAVSPAPAAAAASLKLSYEDAMDRTRLMLHEETGTTLGKILTTSELREKPFPPMDDESIGDLEAVIEQDHFKDVEAKVTVTGLQGTVTVADLCEVIWAGIKGKFKKD